MLASSTDLEFHVSTSIRIDDAALRAYLHKRFRSQYGLFNLQPGQEYKAECAGDDLLLKRRRRPMDG